jgi:hypothetical protein
MKELLWEACKEVSAPHANEDESSRDQFVDDLQLLANSTKLLDDDRFVGGVADVLLHRSVWARSLEDWHAKSHSASKQFSSLLTHLFVDYEVPSFMEHSWGSRNKRHQAWYIHMGAGYNIRTAPGAPTLTRRAAHIFLQTPEHYSIEAAVRRAQILSMGGEESLVLSLLDTRLVEDFDNEETWLPVLDFFVRNPMLDHVWINPIVDFIHHNRLEPRYEDDGDGNLRALPPVSPDFSVKGRTVQSMIRLVGQWHTDLQRNIPKKNVTWAKSGISEFTFVEGADANNRRTWRIREYLCSHDLLREGRAMQHCVASYSDSCVRGIASIWGLELEKVDGVEKRLTIEVQLSSRTIKQARGERNRIAFPDERLVVERWAQQQQLIY